MSNKVKSISKNMTAEVAAESKSVQFRVDLKYCINGDVGVNTMYVIVSGVPVDLPENMKDTVKYAAEAQFVNALNERAFIELYDLGKTRKDSQPRFINTKCITWFEIKEITELK